MNTPLPEHQNHTAWVFETEIGHGDQYQDHHFDAAGFEDAMTHARQILKENRETCDKEHEKIASCRLRPYGLNCDDSYEVELAA